MPEDGWTPIRYPRAIFDDQLQQWVSDAEVAETAYTAFSSTKGKAITARLIVRRVKDLNPRAAAAGQGELFPLWRYHAVFTDSPFELVQAPGTQMPPHIPARYRTSRTTGGRQETHAHRTVKTIPLAGKSETITRK